MEAKDKSAKEPKVEDITPEEDTILYKILSVAKDASFEEIRRQYKLLARRCHPDKNPGDLEAKNKF